jgi:hypothetical protein
MPDTETLPEANEVIKRSQEVKTLCRSVLGSGLGKDLLEHLTRIYVEGNLFQETDRDTVYCIAQRDLIMELTNNSKGEL